MSDKLEELKRHVDRLKELLDSPQPGSRTWCEVYGHEMAAITGFWHDQGKSSPADPSQRVQIGVVPESNLILIEGKVAFVLEVGPEDRGPGVTTILYDNGSQATFIHGEDEPYVQDLGPGALTLHKRTTETVRSPKPIVISDRTKKIYRRLENYAAYCCGNLTSAKRDVYMEILQDTLPHEGKSRIASCWDAIEALPKLDDCNKKRQMIMEVIETWFPG